MAEKEIPLTPKIHLIEKVLDADRIIIKISAYDKKNNLMFSFSNKEGIGANNYEDRETALYLSKLTQRKNSAFKITENHSNFIHYQRQY